MDDEKIIALYWARQEKAISETKRKYGRYCYSIAYRVLRNEQDAEECENDTYLDVWNMIPPIKPKTFSAFLGFDKLSMAILLAVFATPNAVSSYAMARNYEADHELAGEIVTLSTLFSILTIFVFITISKSWGWI